MNALSRVIEKALRAANVPYQMIRGQEFYPRKEIKDVLAYCQLINNPRDDMAFERTINTPPRGIGRKTIERLTEYAYRYGMPLLEAARGAWEIEGLVQGDGGEGARVRRAHRSDHGTVVHGDVEEVLGTVLRGVGYRASLAEQRRRAGSESAGEHRGIADRRAAVRRAEPGRRHIWRSTWSDRGS